MRRFTDELRERFDDRAHVFDRYEKEVGEWEAAFRSYAKLAAAEERLLRVTGRFTARRLVAFQSTNLASRGVNLANGVVLLLNRRNVHAAPAVARALFETSAMAVYADRRLVPLLEKRRSPKRVADAHRLLYRLGLGTHESSEISHIRAYKVEKFVNAMGSEAGEVMRGQPTPEDVPDWAAGRTYGEAVRYCYAMLSELTHPNHSAITMSHVEGTEWVLQPAVDDPVLSAILRPTWLALAIGRVALRDVVRAATDHPMEFPDRDPDFTGDDVNARTRAW